MSYRLFEDVDGTGPAAATEVGGRLTSGKYILNLSELLHTRLNARYWVQACNSIGCSAATAALTPDLTQAIGYFRASTSGIEKHFGESVALSSDGTTLAVGSPFEDTQSGAVYVFTRGAGGWSQQARVRGVNTGPGDYFGASIALSGDGNTLAVAAKDEASAATGINGNGEDNSARSSGAAYVFTRSGAAWSQQAYIKASNAGINDNFGYSIALSIDGNTLAVGAIREASNAVGIGGDQADNSLEFVGAAYVFVRSGNTWVQQAYVKPSTAGDIRFGWSVALSADGSTLAVGASGEPSKAVGINGVQTDKSAPASGAVYVFLRSSGSWTQQAYVKASNTGFRDGFGYSVALSADGHTLAVGALFESSISSGVGGDQANDAAGNAGAAYVFTRNGGTWSQQAYLKASNTHAGDLFGFSLAISADGNSLAVGSKWESSNVAGVAVAGTPLDESTRNSGAVYAFVRSGTAWSQQAFLKSSSPGRGDEFGFSVAVSGDGKTLAVGANQDTSNARKGGGNFTFVSPAQEGAVYLY